jgi:hypothetical protein
LKIDVHAHYVPEKCLDAEAKGTDGHIHGLRIVQEGSRHVAYTNNARNLAFDIQANRGFLILVARLTTREHNRIFRLCHYFAISK